MDRPTEETHIEVSEAAQPETEREIVVERRSRISGCGVASLGCFALLLIVAILVLAPVFMGFITLNDIGANVSNAVQSVVNPRPPTASTWSTQSIVQSVLPLGQLVSIRSQMAKADISVGVRQGTLNACGYSANHVAQGTIEAGIDLTMISADDIVYDEELDRYILTLPAPELTSCHIDYIRQYDRTVTACPVDWDEATQIAWYAALNEFRSDAIEGGILERAEREARVVMENFIEALTERQVQIVFREPAQSRLPASCEAAAPSGWTLNADGSWLKTG